MIYCHNIFSGGITINNHIRFKSRSLRTYGKVELLNNKFAWTAILPWMLFCSVLFGGCGTILTDQGAAVRITNNFGDVMGCRYLGQATASSVLGGYGFKKKGLNSSINELRNNAARMGANMLVIHIVSKNDTYIDMTGDVYQCD